MRVYLVQRLIDECAWITEKVCSTQKVAEVQMKELKKRFHRFERFKIYPMKLVEENKTK